MRGFDQQSDAMFAYISPESFVPKEYPLCPIRTMVGKALNIISYFGIIAVALASVCLVDVSSKAHAGIIPHSFIGPHEYQLPVSDDNTEIGGTKLKGQVTALLEQLDTAFSLQDLNGVMKTYVTGPEIFLMGTGPDEIYRGKEGVEGAYSQFFTIFDKGSLSFTYDLIYAGSRGDIAWFAAEGTVKGKVKDEVKVIRFNLSGTLLKQKGAWRFIAMHFSRLGVAAQPMEEKKK
jgi:ketosteroid isomerase-like protein